MQLMTSRECADHLRISLRTLASLRAAGNGPPFVLIGSAIRYQPAAVDLWIEGQTK